MSDKKYKNPPIKEVICEFRFALPTSLTNESINAIKGAFDEKFPVAKKGRRGQFGVQVNENSKPVITDTVEEEFDELTTEDGKTRVRINNGILSIHKFPPYNSWEKYSPEIQFVVSQYIKYAKPQALTRVGLRYINAFTIPEQKFNLEDYFRLLPFIADSERFGMEQNLKSFIVGAEFIFEEGRDTGKVILASAPPASTGGSSFALDIDYFLSIEASLSLEETDIANWLITAHHNVKKIFNSALTQKSKDLFDV